MGIGSAVLWAKLTVTSTHYSSTEMDAKDDVKIKEEPVKKEAPPKQEESVIVEQPSSGFLPGRTIVVEKKKEEKDIEPKKTKPLPAPSIDTTKEHSPKSDLSHDPGLKKSNFKHISPPLKEAFGVSKTMNPQYLVENPILKKQKAVIILKGIGLNEVQSDAILDQIDDDVVVAVNPYSTNLADEIDTYRLYGLDTLVMIPLEDLNKLKDQGYLTLRVGMKPDVREKVLSTILDKSSLGLGLFFTGGVGLLKSEPDVTAIVAYLADHNKFVVSGTDVLNNKFYGAADSAKLNYIVVTADDCPVSDADQVLTFIRRTGFAILSFDINTPDVLMKINQWIKILDENKIEIVSISNLLSEND